MVLGLPLRILLILMMIRFYLKDLGTVVTAVMDYVGDICSTIIGQPLLLMTTGFLLIGGCIGIFGRLLSKN